MFAFSNENVSVWTDLLNPESNGAPESNDPPESSGPFKNFTIQKQ